MLMFFIVGSIALAFVYGAIRIIMGWIFPRSFMAKFDGAVDAFFKFVLKLIVVVIGLGIIAAIVYGVTHTP